MSRRIGIDIGGTFTDFTVVDDTGRVSLWKEDSTPDDPGEAIRTGLRAVAARVGDGTLEAFLGDTTLLVHGSTIATNTVIQRNGARVGLVCTEGFRDILYFRDGFKWDRFDRRVPHPRGFVDRYMRRGVRERIDHLGEIIVPLDEDDLRRTAAFFRSAGVDAIAVALLWSMVNDVHERRSAAILSAELPDVAVVLSCDVLPEIREWERTSATVLSAYVLPKISVYLGELEQHLVASGFERSPLIMQINGGCAAPSRIVARPVYALASGPAAAPAAALHFGTPLGASDVITIDMGGTSFDVCLIRDGAPAMSRSVQVERAPIGIPAVEVHSIGAGGGSIAWVDSGGALRVGPTSAGSRPGPVCYAQGGSEPTVTDANLVLGHLSAEAFLGGRRRLDRDAARNAIQSHVADQLGLDVPRASAGVVRVVNANMVDAIQAVSTQRGIDPRGFLLVSGGGAGGLHAARLASEIGITRVLIPNEAGVLCSFGMTVTDVRHDYARAHHALSSQLNADQIEGIFAPLETEARESLTRDGFVSEAITLERYVDARYQNQIYELTIPVGTDAEALPLSAIEGVFHAEHERQFTYAMPTAPIEILHWRVVGVGRSGIAPTEQHEVVADREAVPRGERLVYFDEFADYVGCPTYASTELRPGMWLAGHAIVESETTTIVVPPGWGLVVVRDGFVLDANRTQEGLKRTHDHRIAGVSRSV